VAPEVAVWGYGAGPAWALSHFVSAENDDRKAEVYWSERGICVEFWESGAYFEDQKLYHPTYVEAVAAAAEWLGAGVILGPARRAWWRRLFH